MNTVAYVNDTSVSKTYIQYQYAFEVVTYGLTN